MATSGRPLLTRCGVRATIFRRFGRGWRLCISSTGGRRVAAGTFFATAFRDALAAVCATRVLRLGFGRGRGHCSEAVAALHFLDGNLLPARITHKCSRTSTVQLQCTVLVSDYCCLVSPRSGRRSRVGTSVQWLVPAHYKLERLGLYYVETMNVIVNAHQRPTYAYQVTVF